MPISGLLHPVDLDAAVVPLVATAIVVIIGTSDDVLRPDRRRVVHSGVKLVFAGTIDGLETALEAGVSTAVTIGLGQHRDFRIGSIRVRACTAEPDTGRLEQCRIIGPGTVINATARSYFMWIPDHVQRLVDSSTLLYTMERHRHLGWITNRENDTGSQGSGGRCRELSSTAGVRNMT